MDGNDFSRMARLFLGFPLIAAPVLDRVGLDCARREVSLRVGMIGLCNDYRMRSHVIQSNLLKNTRFLNFPSLISRRAAP